MNRYPLIFLLVAASLLAPGCRQSPPTQPPGFSHFDTRVFFEEQILALEERGAGLEKTLFIDGQPEQALIEAPQWKQEFALFDGLDLDNPVNYGRYSFEASLLKASPDGTLTGLDGNRDQPADGPFAAGDAIPESFSPAIEGDSLLRWLAMDPEADLQRVELLRREGETQWVCIVRRAENVLYRSLEAIWFQPGLGFSVRSTRKTILMPEHRFRLEGRFVY